MDIANQVAIITGGASGLGLEATYQLHAKGASIVIFDLNEDNGKKIAQELGDKVHFHLCDVSNEEQALKGVELAESLGDLRILYNAAGIGAAQKTIGKNGAHDYRLFKKVIEVNLIGSFNVSRLAANVMAKTTPNEHGERGVIVNTASIAAFDGQQGQAAYSASKGGIVGMTLPMARDLARNGIRVNTIAPGIFKTPILGGVSDEVVEMLTRDIEFPKRLGQPKELAHLLCFIIENSYMNGETIRCDGAARLSAR